MDYGLPVFSFIETRKIIKNRMVNENEMQKYQHFQKIWLYSIFFGK